jgi:NAD(P)-dependent dehydrogenase (short-subunit alcohol dehydrogenase family)
MTNELKGKTIIITGANSGIGLATAVSLANKGARICLICRDEKRGLDALKKVKAQSGNGDADLLLADFSSLDIIRAAALEIKSKYKKLDVLINNAGSISGNRQVTRDGYEWTFGVNHLAPFLLTNLLLPLIKDSAPSRIITVSSMVHQYSYINFDDIMSEKKYGEMKAYAQSKLANLLFAFELSRKLAGTGVTSNAVHPGAVRSGFARSSGLLMKTLYSVGKYLLSSPEKGARTSIYLASSPEVERVTGRYFINCKPAKPSAKALDESTAKKLWELSTKLAGL